MMKIDFLGRRQLSFLSKSSVPFDIVKFLLVIAAIIWLIYRGNERLNYNWQWYRIPQYVFTFENGELIAGPLIDGLIVTFHICIVSLLMAFAIGLITAFLRLSNSFAGRLLARGYLELIRNTPLLVQLFFIYFVLSPVLDISRFTSAVLALSLFEGAYASEIFRAGIVGIPRGQWEAALSSGLGIYHTYKCIILPQAIRQLLPPLVSQAISLVKDSALVSTIAIYDLTMRGQAIVAETYLVFEVWFIIALVYLTITVALSITVNFIEKRFSLKYWQRRGAKQALHRKGKRRTALNQPTG